MTGPVGRSTAEDGACALRTGLGYGRPVNHSSIAMMFM